VVGFDEAMAEAEADLASSLRGAREGACESVWPAWKDATRHAARNERWHEAHESEARTAAADCYALRSDGLGDDEAKADALVTARSFDHRSEQVVRRAGPLAAAFDVAGDLLQQKGDLEGAFLAYRRALALDPQLAWTRRKVEAVRDSRLGIGDEEAPAQATARAVAGGEAQGGGDEAAGDEAAAEGAGDEAAAGGDPPAGEGAAEDVPPEAGRRFTRKLKKVLEPGK
jgi:hypothetical protein